MWREDNLFLARCVEIDVDSFGNTVESAKKNLEEAIRLYFSTADEIGTLKAEIERITDAASEKTETKPLKPSEYLSPIATGYAYA
jgi:predicted RNase H-like HicB family nuclease